jgi:tripartite-type tricarboxylate transporter receptor subunit TctC
MNSGAKRLLVGCAMAATFLWAQSAAAADNWPQRSIRIVSPYGAGGPNDLSARLIGEELGARLGQSIVVENRPGAGTAIGNQHVANAAPDGYTLLYAAAPYSTLEALNGKLSYDPHKDLKPVAKVANAPLFLIVNADSPFKTVEDLIAHGKAASGGLTLGSPGHGSLPHLAMELLLRDADTPGIVVQYKGDVGAYTELLAGRLDATLTAITAALPHVQAGKLRVLGVASDKPSAIYPDAVPLKEQGLPNVVASGWYGFMVPAGTPDSVVDTLDKEINSILGEAQIREKLLAQGLEITPGDKQAFGQFIQAEMNKWGEVIKAANLKAN